MRSILKMAITGMATLIITIGLMVLSGCGDDYGTRHKVSGSITYKGEKVAKGRISFNPVDMNKSGSRAADGVIKDGKYYLTSFTDGDGAVEGEYNVTISARDVDESKLAGQAQGGSAKQDVVAKAHKDAKLLAPPKYELSTTTPLKGVKVPGGKYDFELTD